MKITITPMMLCDLCGGKFTLEACEALCDWYDEMLCGDPFAPAIGDICVSFSEIPADDVEIDYDNLIATLNNGNALIAL